MLGRKELKPFHVERWDLAHRAVDYPRWATAGAVYDITYEHVRLQQCGAQPGWRCKLGCNATCTLPSEDL